MAKNYNSSYAGKESAFRHKLFSLLRSPYVLVPGLIAGLVASGILYTYYVEYAEIIDRGLRGDLFVRTSGIYAAPLDLRRASSLQLKSLEQHLQQLGYQEGTSQNEKRGVYQKRGTTIEIYPGSDARIDGRAVFRRLRVTFGRGGSGIESIVDLEGREELEEAEIEPELISTVTNKDREKRKIIEYKDLPATLVDGIVSIEDRQFFEHPGINWRGILRALIKDYQAGAIREGGSSITQQLVKNLFLFPDRTWKRKLAEAYMSLILEQRLSKEEILAMYCNQIYLGQRGGYSINGFGQAARTYFGKDISTLGLPESALLAGIIRSPNYYSPYSNEERARNRRNLVLDKMVEAGKIGRVQAEAAKAEGLGIAGKSIGVNGSDAPYFMDYLMRQLERLYEGDEQSLRSLRIYSTIDLNLQRAAYESLTENMARVEERLGQRKERRSGLQAALVAMNARTGEVLAMVGGRDYATSQLNRAIDARRQPGSVFKPFVYAAALEQGENGETAAITAASLFNDAPQTFEYDGKTYEPGNFGDKYENRPLTVRDALVNSKNVITVEIAQRIGLMQVKMFAEKAGIPNVPAYPSAALGVGEATPLQVAAAYTAFANAGVRVAPTSLKRLTTRDGTTIYEAGRETRPVMSPQLAYIMTSIMQDVLDRGTGTRVRQRGFTGTAAGKTGSSRDAWFAGYTPNIVCVVWIGYDNNADIGLTGGETAAPIWADFMKKALVYRPELGGEFSVPDGLTSYEIDPTTGNPPLGSGGPTRLEYFLGGTNPNDQPLPDSYVPDPDHDPGGAGDPAPARPPAETPGGPLVSLIDEPRPTPTPFRPSTRRVAPPVSGGQEGRIDDFIPAPPRNRPIPDGSRVAGGPGAGGPGLWERVSKAVRVDLNLNGLQSLFDGAIFSSAGAVASEKTGAGAAESPGKTVRKAVSESRANGPATQTRPEARPSPARRATSGSHDEGERRVEAAKVEPGKGVREISTGAVPGSGSFYLSVCQKSGLLPVAGICETTRRRFSFGREPTRQCTAGLHRGE